MTIPARLDAEPGALMGIRREIASIDPNLRIFNAQTLRDYFDRRRSTTGSRSRHTAELAYSV
jgi:hypothetical protein